RGPGPTGRGKSAEGGGGPPRGGGLILGRFTRTHAERTNEMADLTDESTSRFVEVKEGPLETRLHVNDAGEGPAVIMIHGGGPGASGWSNFYRNIGPFADAGFRVLLIDCPGFGQSDPLNSTERIDRLNGFAIVG